MTFEKLAARYRADKFRRQFVPYTERFGEFIPEHTPSFTLDRQVSEARESMGEQRWRQLQAEWDANND